MEKAMLAQAERERMEADDAVFADLPPSYSEATNAHYPSQKQYFDTGNLSQARMPQRYPYETPTPGPSVYAGPSTLSSHPPQRQYYDQRDTTQTWAPQQYAPHTLSPSASPHMRSSSPSRPTSRSTSEDELMSQALHFTHHSPPASASHTHLAQPVVVPQVSSGLGMPFARAYSPALQAKGVSMQDFVEFIDNLNVVSTGSPPLQVLDLAGGVVGMVPHHIPQLVGNALSLTAKLGTAAVSKTRGAMFLSEANKSFFAPRGLRVELVASKVLKGKLGLHPDAQLVSALDESTGLNVQARRMRALERYTAPLTFDVPPPTAQTNALERLSAGQVARQLKKSDKKAMEDREKAMKKAGGSGSGSKADKDLEKEVAKIEKERGKIEQEFEKEMAKVEKDRAKSRTSYRENQCRKDADRAERKRQEELQKLDREMEKALRRSDKESRKDGKDVRKDDREAQAAEKVLWILVEDASGTAGERQW